MGYGESGSKAALPIWEVYMREAIKSLGSQEFSIPAGIAILISSFVANLNPFNFLEYPAILLFVRLLVVT